MSRTIQTLFTLACIALASNSIAMHPNDSKKLSEAITNNDTMTLAAIAQQYEMKTVLENSTQSIVQPILSQLDKNKLLMHAINDSIPEGLKQALEIGADINCFYMLKPTIDPTNIDSIDFCDDIDDIDNIDGTLYGSLDLDIQWTSPLSFAIAKNNIDITGLCMAHGAGTASCKPEELKKFNSIHNIQSFDSIYAALLAKKQINTYHVSTNTNQSHVNIASITNGYLEDEITSENIANNNNASYSHVVRIADNKIAAGTSNGNIFIINTEDKTSITLPKKHTAPIEHLAVMPNEILLSIASNGIINAWNLQEPTADPIKFNCAHLKNDLEHSTLNRIKPLSNNRFAVELYDHENLQTYIYVWNLTINDSPLLIINPENEINDFLELSNGSLAVATSNTGLLIFNIANAQEDELTTENALMQFHNGHEIEKLAIHGTNLLCISDGTIYQYATQNLLATSQPTLTWNLFANTNRYSYFSHENSIENEINEAPEIHTFHRCIALPDGRFALGTTDYVLIIDPQDQQRIIVLEGFINLTLHDNKMLLFKNNNLALINRNKVSIINLGALTPTTTISPIQQYTNQTEIKNLIPLQDGTIGLCSEHEIKKYNTLTSEINKIYSDRADLPKPTFSSTTNTFDDFAAMFSSNSSSSQSSSSFLASSSSSATTTNDKKRKRDPNSKAEWTDSDSDDEAKEPLTKKQKTKK